MITWGKSDQKEASWKLSSEEVESEGEPEVGPKGSQMKVETKVEYARRLERDWVDRHEQLTQEFLT